MMKRLIALNLILLLLLTGCAAAPQDVTQPPSDTSTEQESENNPSEETDVGEEDGDSEESATMAEFGFDFDADYHLPEEVRALIDPDFKLEEYGATGVGGAGTPISCMSFNVLSYDTHNVGYDEPDVRAEAVVAFLREQNADLVGLQEVTNAHGYDWVKTIRDGLSDIYEIRMVTEEEGEVPYISMSIATGLMFLWRKDRFELKESGGFEYWDDSRACHWIRLQDRKAGRELYFTNTHFSIDGGNFWSGNRIRCGEAIELLSFWKNTVGDAPLFATGDYNSKVYDDPHALVLQKSPYQPSCDIAMESDGASTVDFCYVNAKATDVDRYEFLDNTYEMDGTPIDMSDHNPVMTYAVYK